MDKKPYDKEDSNSKITNELVIEFLDSVVSNSSSPYYNLLESNNLTDEEMFEYIINYLYSKDMYTKENDSYVFKQSDIRKIASTYLMDDNYTYIPTNINFTYNSNNKTFTSKLDNVLSSSKTSTSSIDIYEKTESYIYVTYELETYGAHKEKYKYDITIENDNNDFKIKKVITK